MPQRTRSHVKDYSRKPDVTARTREILSNERWYTNGPPQWPVGKAQHPAQTAGEAETERLKLIKRLRLDGPDDPAAQALADRLDSCTPGQRCMSGACPECNRAYTRWFVASTAALLGDRE
jgi:hypothetical protein